MPVAYDRHEITTANGWLTVYEPSEAMSDVRVQIYDYSTNLNETDLRFNDQSDGFHDDAPYLVLPFGEVAEFDGTNPVRLSSNGRLFVTVRKFVE